MFGAEIVTIAAGESEHPQAAVTKAVSAVVFLTAGPVWQLLLGRVLSGLSAGIYAGAATTAVIELAPASWRGRAPAVATAANIGGLGLGPLIAGVLAEYAPSPLHTPFVLDLALLVLVFLGIWRLPETVEVVPQGKTLVIRVSEYPTINAISFEGNRRLKDDKLAEIARRYGAEETVARLFGPVMLLWFAALAALGLMNLAFYEALARLPLGVAVTVEFTGPLTLSLILSRKPSDFLWVLLAAGGIFLMAPRGDLSGVDPLGLGLALLSTAVPYGIEMQVLRRMPQGREGKYLRIVANARVARQNDMRMKPGVGPQHHARTDMAERADLATGSDDSPVFDDCRGM